VSGDLAVARRLITFGVPVFIAKPAIVNGKWDPHGGHDRCGYWLPNAWQQSVADLAALDAYRDGDALCAVMGHGIDVLDTDPRNGGDVQRSGLIEAGVWPNVYGVASTPSGGTHELIRSLGVRKRHGFRPGIDVQAGDREGRGRGFVFIAPTRRASKVDGIVRAYAWTTAPDLDALREDDGESGKALADVLDSHAGDEALHDPTQPFELPEIIRKGERDETLFRYASSLRGQGVRASKARRLVIAALARCEQPPGDEYTEADAEAKFDQAYGYEYDGATLPSGDTSARDVAVQRAADKLRIERDARAIVSAETAATVVIPAPVRLDAFLAEPQPAQSYRIERLMPSGGRVLFAAQHKAGKTTVVGNLIGSLVDGTPFLGSFPVQQARRVVLIDNELSHSMLHAWLAVHGISNTDRVSVLPMRGRMSAFDLLDDATRARWAAVIGSADVLILDCLRPALDVLGLSEDKDAGQFLVAFDALLDEAGIAEGFLVHHMGHVGERARGSSRLLDWPDALWQLVVEGGENGARENPGAPRYLSAYGRDVELSETRLDFEPTTRQLVAVGGSRKDAKAEAALVDVIAFLDEQHEPLSRNKIETTLGKSTEHGRATIRAALTLGVKRSIVLVESGDHGAHNHYLNPSHRSNGATS
jgi:hypothetical protein